MKIVSRIALGIVFLWFGALKFFPGLSPAHDLATRTIYTLTFGLIPASVSVILLATLNVDFADPMEVQRVRFYFTSLRFEVAGTYRVVLEADGRYVAQRALFVRA